MSQEPGLLKIKLDTLPPMETLAARRQTGAKAYRPFLQKLFQVLDLGLNTLHLFLHCRLPWLSNSKSFLSTDNKSI